MSMLRVISKNETHFRDLQAKLVNFVDYTYADNNQFGNQTTEFVANGTQSADYFTATQIKESKLIKSKQSKGFVMWSSKGEEASKASVHQYCPKMLPVSRVDCATGNSYYITKMYHMKPKTNNTALEGALKQDVFETSKKAEIIQFSNATNTNIKENQSGIMGSLKNMSKTTKGILAVAAVAVVAGIGVAIKNYNKQNQKEI